MSERKPVVIRPIHWDRLRPDEAEREIRRRLKLADPFVSEHAFDRMDERGDAERLNAVDMMRVVRTGTVCRQPRKEEDGWVVVVEKRMPGTREAGVVTLIVHPGDDLVVLTVQWMDLL